MFDGDRDFSRFPSPHATSCNSNCSSATPLGRFIVNNPVTGESENLTLKGCRRRPARL